jgi:aspartate/tyrosine/aromatic aminotransferase
MLEGLTLTEPDAVLSLMPHFREDLHPGKMDLGVGVYRDASGATPILRAVNEAEHHHAAAQTTKVYVCIAGEADFNRRVAELTLGPALAPDRTGPFRRLEAQAPCAC